MVLSGELLVGVLDLRYRTGFRYSQKVVEAQVHHEAVVLEGGLGKRDSVNGPVGPKEHLRYGGHAEAVVASRYG